MKGTSESVTFIVPALNEEGNLEATLREIDGAVNDRVSHYEVIIIDDGSDDGTGALADRLAAEHDRVRAIHNGSTRGLGYSYRKGVQLAALEHVMLVPGDNEVSGESIRALLGSLGRVDVVLAYPLNPSIRSGGRRLLSTLFVRLLNGLFGLRLRYYNGPAVFRTDQVRACNMTTNGFPYHAEIVVQLVKSGASYRETGMTIRNRGYGGSKALRWSNWVDAGTTLFALLRRGLWQRRTVPLLAVHSKATR